MIRLLPSLRRTDLGTLLGSIVGVLHKAKFGGGGGGGGGGGPMPYKTYGTNCLWKKRGWTVRFPKPHALDPEP